MGVIQQSINSAIGSAGQAVGIAKGVKKIQESNELAKASAGVENIEQSNQITKEYNKERDDLDVAKQKLKSAQEEYDEAEYNLALGDPREEAEYSDLQRAADKAEKARDAALEMKGKQQAVFNQRKKELQNRLDIVNKKGALYGFEAKTLTGRTVKGGKK